MKQIKGNMWNIAAQYPAICITTNGFVTSRGNAVMGRGCAKTISDMYPSIKQTLGRRITTRGNITQAVPVPRVSGANPLQNTYIVAFPVKGLSEPKGPHNVVNHAADKYKPGQTVPGFHLKADLNLITKSALELVELTNDMGWDKVLLPRPGCGAGELDWGTEVKPILDPILDDRFTVITF